MSTYVYFDEVEIYTQSVNIYRKNTKAKKILQENFNIYIYAYCTEWTDDKVDKYNTVFEED